MMSVLTHSEQEAVARLRQAVAELSVKVPPNGLPEGWAIKGDNEDTIFGDAEYPFTLHLNGTFMASGREYPYDVGGRWIIDYIAAAETAPVINDIMSAWRIYHRDIMHQHKVNGARYIEEERRKRRDDAIRAIESAAERRGVNQ